MISAGAATNLRVMAPSTATTGSAVSFTVRAGDNFDNLATSYAGTVHFTSTGQRCRTSANSTLTNGTVSRSARQSDPGSAAYYGHFDTVTGFHSRDLDHDFRRESATAVFGLSEWREPPIRAGQHATIADPDNSSVVVEWLVRSVLGAVVSAVAGGSGQQYGDDLVRGEPESDRFDAGYIHGASHLLRGGRVRTGAGEPDGHRPGNTGGAARDIEPRGDSRVLPDYTGAGATDVDQCECRIHGDQQRSVAYGDCIRDGHSGRADGYGGSIGADRWHVSGNNYSHVPWCDEQPAADSCDLRALRGIECRAG